MITIRNILRAPLHAAGHTVAAILITGAACLGIGAASASAQETTQKPHHRATKQVAAARPLTVHRRVARLIHNEPIVAGDGLYDGTGLFRRWDDPRLTTFYGWRLGGDNFYGDQAGNPITRGNASLGMIAGYGPANGGYGGPHFDSVGGFHNGPGPRAQEDADYATGNVSEPVFDQPPPRYPSLKQQVADLDSGISGSGQVSRSRTPRERWAEVYRASSQQ